MRWIAETLISANVHDIIRLTALTAVVFFGVMYLVALIVDCFRGGSDGGD